MTMPSVYDESQIDLVLSGLARSGRTLFAVACAEWLFASYEEFAARTGLGDSSELRRVLDVAWDLACGKELGVAHVEQARLLAESLVPSDDSDDWSVLSPIAQNASAGAAYALRTWQSGETQEAVWACRQLYEAADYVLQMGSVYLPSGAADKSDDLVSTAVRGVIRSLELASVGDHDLARSAAVASGLRLRDHWVNIPQFDE